MNGGEKGLAFLWGGSFVHGFAFISFNTRLKSQNEKILIIFISVHLEFQHGKILNPILIHFKEEIHNCTFV